MCTLVVAWQLFGSSPVAIAANRDERFDRPASGPRRLATDPVIIGPRDEASGGTWIGYNEHGVVAAVTNRWTDRTLSGDRSRGLLTLDSLRHPTVGDAARAVQEALRQREYAGFSLLLADDAVALLLDWDGTLSIHRFAPGLHVVMNVGFDDTFDVPADRREAGERQIDGASQVRESLQPCAGESADEWLDRAGTVLGDHEYGVCIHGDGFGTRSSTLLARSDDGVCTHRFADGPPCRTPYVTVETQI